MALSEIAALKAALGARNDLELAAKLGINRSTIAHWKKRGGVPERYRYLLAGESLSPTERAWHQQLFAEPEYHYWLRAALALAGAPKDEASSDLAAVQRERLVVSLMVLSMQVSVRDLGLDRISDDASWGDLMRVLRERYSDEVTKLIQSFAP